MISRKTQSHGILRTMLVALVTVFLTACSDDNLSDLKDYSAKIKARPKSGVEPLPEIKTVATFVFDPEGLRNPFKPSVNQEEPIEAKTYSGISPDFVRGREELESFSLDTLRMVGTVELGGVLWGLLKAGDQTIHRVKAGNFIGKNHGKVSRIVNNKIELTEIISDGPGAWRERQASLALME